LPSGHPFSNFQAVYWSSTTFAFDSNVASFVGFNVGSVVGNGKTLSHFVTAVRGGS
jgi:hypothetical protein